MPRQGRQRAEKSPHHIMCRSIDELLMFNTEEDKEKYLALIKASSKIHRIEILSYCLMDNHIHLLVHPRGGDISKFMQAINNPYAKYYNRIYERKGHLFADRFKNIVVKDLNQLLRNSAYIHNNAKDLLYKGYKSIEDYPYSSIKDYTQTGGGRGLAKPNYIFSCLGGGWIKAQNNYKVLLELQSQGSEKFEKTLEDQFTRVNYETDRKTILRQIDIEKVILTLAKILNISNKSALHVKYQKQYWKFKALVAISLRIYCGISLSEMTKIFMNHTSASIGRYAKEGFAVLEADETLYDKIEGALTIA